MLDLVWPVQSSVTAYPQASATAGLISANVLAVADVPEPLAAQACPPPLLIYPPRPPAAAAARQRGLRQLACYLMASARAWHPSMRQGEREPHQPA